MFYKFLGILFKMSKLYLKDEEKKHKEKSQKQEFGEMFFF